MRQDRFSQVALLLIISMSYLFAFKYSSRVANYSFYLSLAYALALFWLANRILKGGIVLSGKIIYSLVALYMACVVIAFYKIDPGKINVDRWSVITSFWDAALTGVYPYQAKSHMGNYPGPSPMYFMLAFPFYLLGEIGYFSILGFLLIILDICYFFRSDDRKRLAAIFLLLSSPAILWEMIVRSTILVNSALALSYLLWVTSSKNRSVKQYAGMGLAGGLLLATRSIYVVPIIMWCAYCFLKTGRIKELAVYGCCLAVMFIATFIPFIIWDYQAFMKYNPLTLQSDFAGSYMAIVFIMISVALGYLAKTEKQLYLNSGLVVYGAVFIYFIKTCVQHDFNLNLLQYNVDISYFIMALPFLLLAI